MKKRGMEALVATVLLVLITIAAVGIVWGAVMPLIKTSIETSQKCMDAKVGIDTQKGYTSYNPVTKIVSVMISRGESDVALSRIDLKITDNTGTSKIVNVTAIASNEDVTVTQNISESPLSLKGNATYVAVIPVLTIGNGVHVCSVSQEVPLA